jgi:hypothetical protein
MKIALALAMLTAFTGYADAGNIYIPRVNQYLPKPVPGPGPCIACGGVQLKQNYGTLINPAQNLTPNLANKSAIIH